MALTSAQLEHFERRLVEERAYLLGPLNRLVEEERSEDEQDRGGDLSKVPTHLADRGTDTS